MNFRMALAGVLFASIVSVFAGEKIPLSDGKTFKGWNGDTNNTWRIEDGAFIGGSLKAKVPHNEFLCTDRQFTNFILRLKFKIVGTNGFVNGGVQFRSQRVPNHFEASGYQADLGDPSWWGSLYDESRRNKLLVASDMKKVNEVLKRGDWNDYEIRCEGKRIRLAINGTETVDYTEPEDAIPQFGIIGLQVHGGGETEACYKDITVEELRATAAVLAQPFGFVAEQSGYFGGAWKLTCNAQGAATLTIPTSKTETNFVIPAEKLEKFRAALVAHDFFNLKESYGQIVPDGGKRTLQISQGLSQTKTVTLNFLPNITDKKEIKEAKRATLIWVLVRSLFKDSNASDSRPYDKLFLSKQ